MPSAVWSAALERSGDAVLEPAELTAEDRAALETDLQVLADIEPGHPARALTFLQEGGDAKILSALADPNRERLWFREFRMNSKSKRPPRRAWLGRGRPRSAAFLLRAGLFLRAMWLGGDRGYPEPHWLVALLFEASDELGPSCPIVRGPPFHCGISVSEAHAALALTGDDPLALLSFAFGGHRQLDHVTAVMPGFAELLADHIQEARAVLARGDREQLLERLRWALPERLSLLEGL